jgi:hypothetical protein
MALTKSRNRMIAGAEVSILDYGAALDGVTDDTAAWNAALATGRNVVFPEGRSRITNRIAFSTVRGQRLIGSGNNFSKFLVNTDFNMAATSVIRFQAIAQNLVSVGIDCFQPSTNIRNNLVKYPWIVDCSDCPSSEIHDVWIAGCWNGVRLHGNCGQSVINLLKVGGFNCDLHIDGSIDTVRLDHFHSWPLDFAGDANLMSIYSDRTRLAAEFGRVDDLDIGSIMTFQGRIRFANLSGMGHSFGVASRIALDGTAARIEMDAGRMTIASAYGTGGVLNDSKITVTNTGALTIASLFLFTVGSTAPQSWVFVNGPAASLIISSLLCEFRGDGRLLTCDNGGTLSVSSGSFVKEDNITRTQPVIHIASGRTTITGCTVNAPAGGVGPFILVDADGSHAIVGNNFNGWGYLIPTVQSLGCYGPNTGTPALASNANYSGAVRVRRLTGTLNGSGAATVTHGVAFANERVVSLWAAYIGGAGEHVPFEAEYLDGSVVALVAGAEGAGRSYVVMIQYV